jgi:competence protein ComEC
LPYLGNDSSCVLGVSGYGVSLLLPGDISQVVEHRLIRDPQFRAADMLAVPHHGSASSSSDEFVQAVKPRLALISSGYLNQFGLPKAGIIDRYRRIGARVMSTAECGAIRATLTTDGQMETVSARRLRTAIWRQQAADSC